MTRAQDLAQTQKDAAAEPHHGGPTHVTVMSAAMALNSANSWSAG